MSRGRFLDTPIRLEAFKRIFVLIPKIDFFFQGVGPEFLAKNDQVLNSTFFTYFPRDLGVS